VEIKRLDQFIYLNLSLTAEFQAINSASEIDGVLSAVDGKFRTIKLVYLIKFKCKNSI
jgi:hypothetical protein